MTNTNKLCIGIVTSPKLKNTKNKELSCIFQSKDGLAIGLEIIPPPEIKTVSFVQNRRPVKFKRVVLLLYPLTLCFLIPLRCGTRSEQNDDYQYVFKFLYFVNDSFIFNKM